ncbi:hypothetical protein JCM16303_002415 [Sporobolomyces ruberrimus]
MAQRIRPLNQQTHQDQAITSQSSLTQVKTLVDAGIGCIAFLRGLFDEDSFEDAKLEAPRPTDSTLARKGRDKDKADKPSTVRIKKLKKGSCDSADKLIDWIELGVSDGIEKGYLHRLIFAIYLDPEDPTNLVESYTFTFTYETDENGNKRAQMQMHDQMKGMLLNPRTNEDIHQEGEVKRQVQQVIKNLLTSTQLLDELPRRRFFTLRALWYDETPEDYQPPGFKKMTTSWPDYKLTTTSINEAPDTSSLGTIQTGYHGVSVHTVTISHVLETSFDDTITKAEATERNQREAASRQVVWNAQTLVESVTDADDAMKVPEPLGVKDDQGRFVEIESVAQGEEFGELRKKVGLESDEQRGVYAKGLMDQSLIDSNISDNENLCRAIAATSKPAQVGSDSVTQEDPVVNRQHSLHTPVPEFSETAEEYAQRLAGDDNGFDGAVSATVGVASVDVQMGGIEEAENGASNLKSVVRGNAQLASPPSVESQLLEFSQRPQLESNDTIMNESSRREAAIEEERDEEEPDTIATDSQAGSGVTTNDGQNGPAENRASANLGVKPARRASEDEICECGDSSVWGGMVCCSSCESWRHNACYGYNEEDDTIPDVFTCYRCRAYAAGADESSRSSSTRLGEIKHALADLTSLALFRRAIALIWDVGNKERVGANDSAYLSENLEVDKTTAAQVLRRLKAEEFLVARSARKSSRAREGKNATVSAEQIVNKSKKQVEYKESKYFCPGRGAEKGLLARLTASIDDDVDEEAITVHPIAKNSPRTLVPATPSPAFVSTSARDAPAPSLSTTKRVRNQTLTTLTSKYEELGFTRSCSVSSLSSIAEASQGSNGFRDESTPRNGSTPIHTGHLVLASSSRATNATTIATSPTSRFAAIAKKDKPSFEEVEIRDEQTSMQVDIDEDNIAPTAQVQDFAAFSLLESAQPPLPSTAPVGSTSYLQPPSSSMPNLPTKRRAESLSPERDNFDPVSASQGEARPAWKKSKKQKASESEENLEAE